MSIASWSAEDIGNPAGICIANTGRNPLNLAKNDIIHGSVAAVGDDFTYEITCDNLLNSTMDVENVTILDTMPPELDFVSATSAGSAWSQDSFTLGIDMTNLQDPNDSIVWQVEYDDAEGYHHVIYDVPEFCGQIADCP